MTIKYERVSDVCYGCGRLGHTSINCVEEVAMSDINQEQPKFGPWLVGTRPRAQNRSYRIEGDRVKEPPKRDMNRKTWRDVMNSVSTRKGIAESSNQWEGERIDHGSQLSKSGEESHSVMQEPHCHVGLELGLAMGNPISITDQQACHKNRTEL